MRYFFGLLIIVSGVSGLWFCFRWFLPIALAPTPYTISVILFTVAGVIVATSNAQTFFKGYKALFSSKYVISEVERDKAARLFKLISKAVLMTSIIVFCLVAIDTMQRYVDVSPNDKEWAIYVIHVGFNCVAYSLFTALAFFELPAYALKNLISRAM